MQRNIGSTKVTPLVSVVMPAFNTSLYIDDAVRSVMEQSLRDIELIIVDDGSMDGTREIAQSYAKIDGRIKVLCQEHRGLIRSLNRGCGLAMGRYIARLDSDDRAMSSRLAEQVQYIENQQLGLLGGGVECIDEDGNGIFTLQLPSCREGLRDFMMLNNYIAHTTVMFRREIFDDLGGYRTQFKDAEDYDLFLRVGDKYEIDNLSTIICQYRLHGGQVSVRNASQQIISSIGARLAAWERRRNQSEPFWKGEVVSREDLTSLGVSDEKIRSLTKQHEQVGVIALKEWRSQLY
jgi:glycosyltransferase involved in cell wall biosynthesis